MNVTSLLCGIYVGQVIPDRKQAFSKSLHLTACLYRGTLKTIGQLRVVKSTVETERCGPSRISEHTGRVNNDLTRAIL